MALPAHLQQSFSSEEIQFIVENEPIKIFPRITTRQKIHRNDKGVRDQTPNRWQLITTGDKALNNMVAMRSTEAVLWIALLLKQQSKCSIVAPQWLTTKELDRKIQYEKAHPDRFSELPWNWLVLARILFSKAKDDFHDPIHELRGKIQDLREIRQVKVLKGLKYLNESHLQLDNLSLLEINELRPFITDIMDKLREIHAASLTVAGENEEEDFNN
ncbi:PSF2-like protein [Saccharomyces kudriavzevii IFO 1802]|uniref:DNA replication complex GINS protein PSF2 n=1 Tax=Saccharomyces kudriavzevii (strain ATCC MYA-4449 / AS 2.2408 / CBS 8840 / NBRC 1802 / NCYC 2889) TaxID=226230 RepID=J6ECZ0_SACK1|nr:PSF2-like protein [Saccharomyces kudriavzevii IFO 1802]